MTQLWQNVDSASHNCMKIIVKTVSLMFSYLDIIMKVWFYRI